MIILKLACSELFCLDSVVSGSRLMIFQSSCKHRIVVSCTFKQKRSLQFGVQPTSRCQVPRYRNNFSLTACVVLSHSSTALDSQFLGPNGTELGLHFIFFAILRASGVGRVKNYDPCLFLTVFQRSQLPPFINRTRLFKMIG